MLTSQGVGDISPPSNAHQLQDPVNRQRVDGGHVVAAQLFRYGQRPVKIDTRHNKTGRKADGSVAQHIVKPPFVPRSVLVARGKMCHSLKEVLEQPIACPWPRRVCDAV